MKRIHLAGIIPVANLKTDFDIDTPEILLPVEPGFTAIQKSVFECAMAGCRTIWIVANEDLAPIVRHRVGEWVHDPVWYSRGFEHHYKEKRREIPIYYVPLRPKNVGRRDSYGWSIIAGINMAWYVSFKISRWVVPEKYFISFPMAAHDIYSIREHRLEIAKENKNFILTHEGKSVKDNLPLSFTMTPDDFKHCRANVNKKKTRTYAHYEGDDLLEEKERLPFEERWSARHFELDEVFEQLSEKDAHKVEANWFYDLSNWEGYRAFMGSEHRIEKPYKGLNKSRKHVKIAIERGKQ